MKTDTLRTAEQIPQQSTMRIPADSRIPDAEHLRMYTEEEVSSMLHGFPLSAAQVAHEGEKCKMPRRTLQEGGPAGPISDGE